ncbi:MAG: primosomal protein N' [Actinomycetes bacterium]
MPSDDKQLSLTDLPPAQAPRRAARARKKGARLAPALASHLPVARVAVDISLPHLDRLFDYAVTDTQSDAARAGVRVRVRFAGQLVDGYLIERVAASQHEGKLARLASVVSDEPVLTPEIARLARTVADRYAGALADVLRLAIPPRHAGAERADTDRGGVRGAACAWVPGQASTVASVWSDYDRGPGILDALRAGRSPRAAWCALPGVANDRPSWTDAVAELISAVNCAGRGAIVVVPDAHDVAAVSGALASAGTEAVALTADLGPRERYRRWVGVLRGGARVVVGTRAAIYAPVHDLGVIVVWDDGNDLHAEPRAPYPHTREVAALRAHQSGVALVIGGYLQTAESAAFVSRGFVQSLEPDRGVTRQRAPRVRATSDAVSNDDPVAAAARLPTSAWREARAALDSGPVLVQVPRAGYLPRLSCERCRTVAHCPSCQGPLQLLGGRGSPVCPWCAAVASAWQCPECGSERLRAAVVGAQRTAEELGRAFPGTPILTSDAQSVRHVVTDQPALVVATPGAEPLAPHGYAAALLLDTWALLGRADLRASEEALRRWFAAAALVRGSDEGGRVVLVGEASVRPVQALVRWDPAQFAAAELADRTAVGLPPAQRIAVLRGLPDDLTDLLNRCSLPPGAEQLGPVELRESDDQQVIIRVDARLGADLAAALAAAQGERSVRKDHGRVTVRIDPAHIG